jgi:hypothetical protein
VNRSPGSRLIRIAEGVSPEEATLQFMMNCILYSRIETGLESNTDGYDEDVNIYLAHLLNSFINPRYYRAARKYVAGFEFEIYARVEAASDARIKYTIYKTNADFLLLSLGVFGSPDTGTARPLPCFAEDRDARIARARTYYRHAGIQSRLMMPRSASISEVLEKLSVGFDKYLQILSHIRCEYFHICRRITAGEEFHLRRAMDEAARREEKRRLQDEFIDLYSAWVRKPEDAGFRRLKEVCRRLREMDPDFTFEPALHPQV